jgi:hypothetical protein
VDASNHPRAEASILKLRISLALDPAIFLKVIVEPLYLNDRQLVRHDFSDARNDVVLNI